MPVSSSSQARLRIASVSKAWTEWVRLIGAEELLVTRSSQGISPCPGKYRVSVTDATLDPTADALLLEESSPQIILTEGSIARQDRMVLTLPARTVRGILEAVLRLGREVGRVPEAIAAVAELESSLKRLRDRIGVSKRTPDGRLPRVLFLKSLREPAAADELARDIIEMAGGRPVPDTLPHESLTWSDIRDSNPDVVALAVSGRSAEHALDEMRSARGDLSSLGTHRIFAFDGDTLFYRPSPAVYRSIEVLASALYGIDVGAEPWEMQRFESSESGGDLEDVMPHRSE